MASFTLNGITYTAVYIDTAKPSNGDGLTPSTAFNIIPNLYTVAANTALILRRNPTHTTISANPGIINDNCAIIGSPLTTDSTYTIIPSASEWSGDASTYATLAMTVGASGLHMNGANAYVDRLSVVSTTYGTGHTGTSANIAFLRPNAIIKNCSVSVSGVSYSAAQAVTPVRNGIFLNGDNCSIDNTTIEVPDNGIQMNTSANNITFSNVIVKQWEAAYPIYSGLSLNNLVLNSCDVYTKYASSTSVILTSTLSTASFTNCNFYNDNITNTNFNLLSTGTASNTEFLRCRFNIPVLNGSTNDRKFISTSSGTITFKDCIFENATDNTTGGTTYLYNGGTSATFIGCTFDVLGMIGTPTAAETTINIMSNCTFLKNASVAAKNPMYLENVSYNYAPCIGAQNTASLYINNVNISGASLTNAIYVNGSAKLYINNLDVNLGNGPTYNYINFGASESTALYVKNEAGVVGNWTARSLKTSMFTSSTYRTGGKNYSIKCQSYSAPASTKKPYLWMAPSPFDGIPIYFGTTGNKKLTVYFAHKLYDPANQPSLYDILVEIETPKSGVGTDRKLYTSLTQGIITTDGSTWNNDPGLTTNKLELFLNMPQIGNAYCRIGFYKFQPTYSTGYLVIDPGIQFIDLP